MNPLRTFLLTAVVAWCQVPATQTTKMEQGKPAAISVALRAERDTVKVGDEIVLKQTLTNRSDQAITLGVDVYHPGCALDVVDEAGKFAPDRKLGYHRGRIDYSGLSDDQILRSGLLKGKMIWVTLKPGETNTQTQEIGGIYDLAKPGVYKITSECYDPQSAKPVRSNTIDLIVAK